MGQNLELVGGWTSNPALQFVGTAALCAFFSVGVQAINVCCITVVIFGLVALLNGGKRRAETILIQQQ